MTARAWAIRLAAVLDLIALTSLAVAPDVDVSVFLVATVLWLLLLGPGLLRGSERRLVTLNEVLLFFVALALLTAAGALTAALRLHPLLSAAYGAAGLFALSWLAPETSRYRAARLGTGLAVLVLASALSTEVSLFFLVFAYVLVAALQLSCAFLDRELEGAGQKGLLPRGYLSRSAATAFAVFTAGLVIFPILPRMRPGSGGGDLGTSLGYTETVRMNALGPLAAGQSSRPVLRVFITPGDSLGPLAALATAIPGGLLRSRVLARFDGKQWTPSLGPARPTRAQKLPAPSAVLEVLREALPTTALPVPYTARTLQTTGADGITWPASLDIASQWQDVSALGRPTRYVAQLAPPSRGPLIAAAAPPLEERPRPEHLEVGPAGPLLRSLLPRLGLPKLGRLTNSQKEKAILAWLEREGFTASLDSGGSPDAANTAPPLETFLNQTRRGHCELFSSATALLLRQLGVPTRLVTGFRVSRAPVGGVLLVRGVDAHAWLEYWDPRLGWVASDPTPRVFVSPPLWESLRDAYDWVGTYWSRYVISYASSGPLRFDWNALRRLQLNGDFNALGSGLQPGAFTRWWRARSPEQAGFATMAALSFAGLIAALAVALRTWWRGWPRELWSSRSKAPPGHFLRRLRLLRARTRVEAALQSPYPFEGVGSSAPEELSQWKRAYDLLRFGKPEAQSSDLQALERLGRQLTRSGPNRGSRPGAA